MNGKISHFNISNAIKETKFWINQPDILFTDLVFFPTADMTLNQKLNALTRLSIVIAVVMYVMEYPHWLTFLLIANLAIIIMFVINKSKGQSCGTSEGSMGETYSTNNAEIVPGTSTLKEHFTITPTHIDDDFAQTVVAPLFAEEHKVLP